MSNLLTSPYNNHPFYTRIKSQPYVKPELEDIPNILEGSFLNSLSWIIKDKDKKNPKAGIDSMDWEEED